MQFQSTLKDKAEQMNNYKNMKFVSSPVVDTIRKNSCVKVSRDKPTNYEPWGTTGHGLYKRLIDGGKKVSEVIELFISDFMNEYYRMGDMHNRKKMVKFLQMSDRIARSIAHNSNDCYLKTYKLSPFWMQIFIAQTCILSAEIDPLEYSTEKIEGYISELWSELGWNVVDSLIPMYDEDRTVHTFEIATDSTVSGKADIRILLDCYREYFDGDRLESKSGKTYEVVSMDDNGNKILMDCATGKTAVMTNYMMKDLELIA